MVLHYIDWTDDGLWKSGAIHPYSSRKAAAQGYNIGVYSIGGGEYAVLRDGGEWHNVFVCTMYGVTIADCNCVDFVQYGADYSRACMHIWKVYLTKNIGVC